MACVSWVVVSAAIGIFTASWLLLEVLRRQIDIVRELVGLQVLVILVGCSLVMCAALLWSLFAGLEVARFHASRIHSRRRTHSNSRSRCIHILTSSRLSLYPILKVNLTDHLLVLVDRYHADALIDFLDGFEHLFPRVIDLLLLEPMVSIMMLGHLIFALLLDQRLVRALGSLLAEQL